MHLLPISFSDKIPLKLEEAGGCLFQGARVSKRGAKGGFWSKIIFGGCYGSTALQYFGIS
jgi:hypothetical protein